MAADALPFPTESLIQTLRRAFGHADFRANQQAVCQAAVDGQDLLLVMPTGSGKSLCYQLPAIVRGGTALVVSPLIALIEDQYAKLQSLGFNAARIHSGLDRAVSRQACVDYLAGNLNFLFIAPERLRVPGFPEMLAKRKPALIAIDEAHCISQWGHDFRPDYRMLGQYLPALRPAPVLALTATATPTVQRDILAQLGLTGAKKFIHGFRRNNLAIEVNEVPLPMRGDLICELLKDPSKRPVIVYAQARKASEAIAGQLSTVCSAAAYHAGLPSEIREDVQQRFQAGALDCVVATIAFGMGIDKANVRTVIHAALPSSLEGYYQEIGRAGRDGQPSRAILMHSYADIRTHEFFLKRDYPPIDSVQQVWKALAADPRPLDEIRESLRDKVDEETFSKAIEKLFIHGGAAIDYNNNATRGAAAWTTPYTRQSDYRRNQLQLVQKFVEGHQCRMAALVLHFGDLKDGQSRCGLCDFCNPSEGSMQSYRAATANEQRTLRAILESLRGTQGKSLGKLLKEMPGGIDRKQLDIYLSALAKAGLILVEDAEWIKEGETILFRKAMLTAQGENYDDNMVLDLPMPVSGFSAGLPALPSQSKPARKPQTNSAPRPVPEELSPAAQQLEQALKAWRTEQARNLGMPPFVILHDRTLRAIAHVRPSTPNQLAEISGIGPAKAEKYGVAILAICNESAN